MWPLGYIVEMLLGRELAHWGPQAGGMAWNSLAARGTWMTSLQTLQNLEATPLSLNVSPLPRASWHREHIMGLDLFFQSRQNDKFERERC